MIKKLICKWFNLIPYKQYNHDIKSTIRNKSKELQELEKNLNQIKNRYKMLQEQFEIINKENKANYNRANRYYMRIKRTSEYINNNTNNVTKKHFNNIIDILDGADNDKFK
jgi:peptidoglycan hydrolase CwlO-like protein